MEFWMEEANGFQGPGTYCYLNRHYIPIQKIADRYFTLQNKMIEIKTSLIPRLIPNGVLERPNAQNSFVQHHIFARNLVPFQQYPINMKYIAELLFRHGVQELLFGQYRLTQNVISGAPHIFTNDLVEFFKQFPFSDKVAMTPIILKFLDGCRTRNQLNLLNRMGIKFTLVDEKQIGSVEFDATSLSEVELEVYPQDSPLGAALNKYDQVHIRGLILQRYLQSFSVNPLQRTFKIQHYCTFTDDAAEFTNFVSMGHDSDFLCFVTEFFSHHKQNSSIIRQNETIYRPPMTAKEFRIVEEDKEENARRQLSLGFARVTPGATEYAQDVGAEQRLAVMTTVQHPICNKGRAARPIVERGCSPQMNETAESGASKIQAAGGEEPKVLQVTKATNPGSGVASRKPVIQETPQLIEPGIVAFPNLYQHQCKDDFIHQISRWTQGQQSGVGSQPTVVKRAHTVFEEAGIQVGASVGQEMSLGRPFLKHKQVILKLDTQILNGVQPVRKLIAQNKFGSINQLNLSAQHRFSIHRELEDYFLGRTGQKIKVKQPQNPQNAQILNQLKDSIVPDAQDSVQESAEPIVFQTPQNVQPGRLGSRKAAFLSSINVRMSDANQIRQLKEEDLPSPVVLDSNRGSMDFALFHDGRSQSGELRRLHDSPQASSKQAGGINPPPKRPGHWVASSLELNMEEKNEPRPKRNSSQPLANQHGMDSLPRSVASVSDEDHSEATHSGDYPLLLSDGTSQQPVQAGVQGSRFQAQGAPGQPPNRFQQVHNAEDEVTESDAVSQQNGDSGLFMLGRRTSVTEVNVLRDMSVMSTDAQAEHDSKRKSVISGQAEAQLPPLPNLSAIEHSKTVEFAPLSAEALAQVDIYKAMLQEREELKDVMKEREETSDTTSTTVRGLDNDSRANERSDP